MKSWLSGNLVFRNTLVPQDNTVLFKFLELDRLIYFFTQCRVLAGDILAYITFIQVNTEGLTEVAISTQFSV